METQKTSEQKIFRAIAVIMLLLIAPIFAHASGDPVVYGIAQGRLTSIIAGLVALISIIMGVLALRSSASASFKKRIGTLSIVLGSLSAFLSLIHLANSTGGFGTGSGKAGAIVAIILGMIGTTLGGMALSRSRNSVKQNDGKITPMKQMHSNKS